VPRLSAAVMMTITVTMLIYVVLLAPTAFEQSGSGYLYLALDRVLGGRARRGGPMTAEADLVSPGRSGQV